MPYKTRIFIASLSLALSAEAQTPAASSHAEAATSTSGILKPTPPVAPSWPKYIELGGSLSAKEKQKLSLVWEKIVSTPTGRDLVTRLEGIEPIQLGHMEPDNYGNLSGNGVWDDEYRYLGLNPETIAAWPAEHLAWLVAHELEHVFQSEKAGLKRNGETACDHETAVKEECALALEHRLWVELGRPSTDSLKGGHNPRFGALRKKSFSAYPNFTRAAWKLSNNGHVYKTSLSKAHPLVQKYLVEANVVEKKWREENAAKFTLSEAEGKQAAGALLADRALEMYPVRKIKNLGVSDEVLKFIEETEWESLEGVEDNKQYHLWQILK
jgi:hypothetical protein